MTRTRAQQICCQDTSYYHCISCVVRNNNTGHSLFSTQYRVVKYLEFSRQEESNHELTSLYAGGFSANSFVDVIECSKIWQGLEDKS